MKELNGRVAVVTGAASGIGYGLSKRFVAEGMQVVMADVEEEALARSATQLEADGADVLGVLCDVSDAAAVRDLAEQTLSAYGGVHVVCNNAGVGPAGLMLETTPEEWDWIVGVNVMGVAHGVITFAPLMVEAGEGPYREHRVGGWIGHQQRAGHVLRHQARGGGIERVAVERGASPGCGGVVFVPQPGEHPDFQL